MSVMERWRADVSRLDAKIARLTEENKRYREAITDWLTVVERMYPMPEDLIDQFAKQFKAALRGGEEGA